MGVHLQRSAPPPTSQSIIEENIMAMRKPVITEPEINRVIRSAKKK